MKNAVLCAVIAAVGAAAGWLVTRNPWSILIGPILFAALYMVFRKKDAIEMEENAEAQVREGNENLIQALAQQTEALAAGRQRIHDPAIGGKLDAIGETLAHIQAFLSAEPREAGKLRQMIRHYLPDLVEAVHVYGRTEKYGVIDVRQFTQYLDTLSTAFAQMYRRLFEHKELAIEVNMEVAQSLLQGSGILSAKDDAR